MTDFEQAARDRVESLDPEIDLGVFGASFNLFRASTRIIQDLESTVHRPLGLSTAGFRILFTIWTLGEMEPRELARLAGVSRAAISGSVNTLVTAGLVEKSREQQDRRLITVRLTSDGAALVATSYRQQNEREQELFASLSRQDLEHLRRILGALVESDRSGAHD